MGKIVKFCSPCDEGFAEKFSFCPNCGGALQAFEMNPVVPAAAAAPPPAVVAAPRDQEYVTPAPPAEKIIEPTLAPEEAVRETEPVAHLPEPVSEIEEVEEEPVEEVQEVADEPVEETVEKPVRRPAVPATAAATAAFATPAATQVYRSTRQLDADRLRSATPVMKATPGDDGGFYVTVIEEKNAGQRNMLLLGSFAFMVLVLTSALVYNIFSKDLEVGSINDDIFNAVLVDDVPTEIEEQQKIQKKDKGGGGGGGGKEEKEETTQGDLADQAKNPTRPPDAKVFRSDNFELKTPPPQTEGNRTFEKKFDRWGDPNGRFASFSNGTGSGGGQGSGIGTGQGSGRGTGAGSGDGSGSGGGLGSGNGNGRGNGDDGDGGPPPPKKAGITQNLAITGKPRPGYTDAARTANVQGTVILRVTFLASGQVGSISPVKGLPNGLTEQAIAAARRISFTPKTVDGVPPSVTKQIEYTFSIY
jgi:protein TonB